jgi:hypothetical protein
MKKIFFTLLLASGIAQATPTVTGEYHISENLVNNATSSVFVLGASDQISKTVRGDIFTFTSQADATGALVQRIEGGLTYRPISWIYVRGAVGQRFSNTGNNPYYSIEPGVTHAVDKFRFRFGYRIRDAVNADNYGTQTENTLRYRVGYALTKKDTVNFGIDRTSGDVNSRATIFSYSRQF